MHSVVIGDAIPTTPQKGRPELRIAVTYLVLASIWIVGCDLLLDQSPPADASHGLMHSLKGFNFVITTAVMLFFVLRRAYSGWRAADEKRVHESELERKKFRCLSSRVQALREEDRTRVAREIHDELGQLLTGIKMEVRLIENRLADRNDRSLNPIIDRLVETAEMVDTTICSIQRISAGLRPSTLDDLGLATALRDEAALFSERSGISCSLHIADDLGTLPPGVTTNTFRIFQEALTNVVRHAGAQQVMAHLGVKGHVLTLEITDDGKGIAVAEIQDAKSLGLIGMFERADSMSGKIEFRNAASGGTTVVLTIPLLGLRSLV